MLKRTAIRTLLLLTLASPWAGADERFDDVTVFGDSLSDQGNLESVTPGGFPPPLFMGRVSNGPVAVEHLALALGLETAASLHLLPPGPLPGNNYAVAGARAAGAGPLDLETQIDAFLLRSAGQAPREALYFLLIGSNDVRDARDAPDRRAARRLVDQAVGAVADALERLAAAGAERFLVVGAPDIGGIPETAIIAERTGDRSLARRATRYSKRFNRKLRRAVRRLERRFDVDVVEFDLFRFIRRVRRNGDAFGLVNVDDACFFQFTVAPPQLNPECLVPPGIPDFDRFFYFDEIHPTARTHVLTGAAFGAALEDDRGDRDKDKDADD